MIRKQFQPIERSTIVTQVIDHVGKFIPEMSLPVKDILSQFAYVDNVRLLDLMKQGYFGDETDDFETPDFASLDIAEKQELYEKSKEFIAKYEQEQMSRANNKASETDD